MQIALCKRFKNMASQNPNPYRLQFKFWLDENKPDEKSIADIIEKLKNSRRYAAAIRDGLRLVWDLSQGKTDVLLELFPFVKQALSGNGGDDNGGISKADLERLEALIKESRIEPIAPPLAASGLKPLGGLKTLAAPTFQDDDEDMGLMVSKSEGGGDDATRNFLQSMLALQQ
jgi:hypothetical protein